jgi:hypothetical protein
MTKCPLAASFSGNDQLSYLVIRPIRHVLCWTWYFLANSSNLEWHKQLGEIKREQSCGTILLADLWIADAQEINWSSTFQYTQ